MKIEKIQNTWGKTEKFKIKTNGFDAYNLRMTEYVKDLPKYARYWLNSEQAWVIKGREHLEVFLKKRHEYILKFGMEVYDIDKWLNQTFGGYNDERQHQIIQDQGIEIRNQPGESRSPSANDLGFSTRSFTYAGHGKPKSGLSDSAWLSHKWLS